MDIEAGKTLTNEEVIRELLELLKKNAMKEQANKQLLHENSLSNCFFYYLWHRIFTERTVIKVKVLYNRPYKTDIVLRGYSHGKYEQDYSLCQKSRSINRIKVLHW